MSFSLEEHDYHDAILNSLDVDYLAASITLRLDAYGEGSIAKRSSVILKFSAVESFNAISNIKDISNNISFGNVNYIRETNDRRTYIYLSNGVLEILSDAAEVSLDLA